MDELRFVRREELALIVANDAGEEFRLLVDDAVLAELRHLSRRERSGGSAIRPREIQALIRSGKSRAQVAQETGLEEADIERYAEPVLAERRYILERAQAVAVRADSHDDDEQSFGAVINARLAGLGAEASEWDSWKEDEAGWMIGLEFISRETAHRAVWSFDHRKAVLSPVTTDAVNLSKQGEVGDRLIPKLRAVDDGDRRGRFDADAFDPSQPEADDEPAEVPEARPEEADAAPANDPDAEYERRREIDQRAVKTDAAPGADLSQTADLLDALRRRRGERERSLETPAPAASPAGQEAPQPQADRPSARPSELRPANDAPADRSRADDAPAKPRSIWAAGGVSREAASAKPAPAADPSPAKPATTPAPAPVSKKEGKGEQPAKKGRASIPSWDDILFGTRSDEDPA